MKTFERRKIIIDILNQYEEITIKKLSSIIKEGEDKIRRDIRILSNYGVLKSVYGGVKKLSNTELDIENYFFNDHDRVPEKERIAKKALEMIKENDSIFIGAGRTTFKLAMLLYKINFKLDVVTVSLPVATILSKKENINLILIGGELVQENYSFEGNMVSKYLKYYNLKKAFIGMRGFNFDYGFTIPKMEQVITTEAVAKSVEKIILLVDSSKFDTYCLMRVGTFKNGLLKGKFKKLITDNKVKEKYVNKLETEGMEVILV